MRKSSSSRDACSTRSRRSLPPRTTRWSARRRRSRTTAITARMREMSAPPAAARATTPAVEDRSCTAAKARGQLALEDRGVARLVVVELLLARHTDDLDLDRHRGADRRRLAEGDVRLGGRARLGLVERLLHGDRL